MELSNVTEIRPHVPEGLTIILEAPQRYGKTLGLTILAVDAFQTGRRIFSNYQLGIPHEPLVFTDVKLEDGSSKFWNGFVALDELNFLFDGRRSLTGTNVEFAAWLLQQKKQGCTLAGTTHDLASLDVRLRMNYDYLYSPKVYPKYPEVPQFIELRITNGPLQAPYRRRLVLDCRPFLNLYDTFAVYDPFKDVKKKKVKDEDWEPRPPRVRLGF